MPYRESAEPYIDYIFINVDSGGDSGAKLSKQCTDLSKMGYRFVSLTSNEHRFIVIMEKQIS